MTVYRRKGVYEYDFWVSRQRYRGSTRRKRKAEAKDVEAAVRKELLDAKQLGVRGAISIGDALDRYLRTIKHQADHVKQGQRARKALGELKGRFGLKRDLPLHAIDNAVVSELVEARQAEGNKPRTINLELALLQRVWNVARKKWGVRVDPTIDWAEHKFQTRGIPRPLTKDEQDRLIAELAPSLAITRQPPAWRTMELHKRRAQDRYDFVVFLLDTGMRHDEAARIMWDKIELNRGVISVFRKKVQKESLIGISERLRDVLTRRFRERTGPWVFTNDDQSGPRPYTSSRSITAAMDRVGINGPDLVERYGRRTVHQLRDTFATRVGRKVGILGIKGLLGHASVRTSEKYTDLISDKLAFDAAEALNST